MKKLQVIYNQEVLGKDFHIYGTVEEPLFLAKDVAKLIEHSNSRMMLKNIDEDEKVVNNVYTLGGTQEMLFLTEAGLYEVLFQSRKPIAKQFKRQVKSILKEIRRTGGYIDEGATHQQLEQLQQKINMLTNYKIKGDTINDVCSATGLRRKTIKEYLFNNGWVEEYNGEISDYDGRYIYVMRRRDVHFTKKGLDKILKDLQPRKPKRVFFDKELYRK